MAVFLKLCFYFLTVVLSYVKFTEAKKPTATCYVAAWASYRGKFNIRDSDTQHCTHVIYAFMGINENTSEIKSIDPLLDLEEGGKGKNQLKELKFLKLHNQDIKVLASVGGYNEGSVKFSEMASNSALKTAFINSLIKFIRDWELDGIDICWQFPGQYGGRSNDRKNFINLLSDIKAVFEPKGWLLTVHILAKRTVINLGYDVKSISQIVDYINLAAVEYHGPWDRTTGIMAPLYSTNENSVTYMVDYVLNRGAIPSKVLLGLPTYGHAYIIDNKVQSDKYLEIPSDKAFASPWTNEAGIIAYNEICMNLKNDSSWNEGFDQDSFTPIAYKDNIFVSFDNEKSLIEKAKLVNSRKLGGIMLWSLDMDDFIGQCHNKSYPMLSAVTDFLMSEEDNTSNNKNKQLSTNETESNEKRLLSSVPLESKENKQLTLNSTELKENAQLSANSSKSDPSPNKGANQVRTVNIITMLIPYIFYVMSF